MAKLENNGQKRLALFAVCLLFLMCVLPVAVNMAPDTILKYDNTYVMDDLGAEGVEINGMAFALSDYPQNDKGSLQSLTFVEYCYSPDPARQGNYGLYVYIYNPARLNIDMYSNAHFIQLADTYNESGKPVSYKKYPAECLSISRDRENDKLFAKFKIKDPAEILERVHKAPLIRQYDVSGIEIHMEKEGNAQDFAIGGTYTFSGYAAGCDPNNANSTLTSSYMALDVLHLETTHTTFKTETSALGRGHQNAVNSVYFSIPGSTMEKYGDTVTAITAQWYEYKTKEIAVTSDLAFYNAAMPKVGVQMPKWSMDYAYSKPDFEYALVMNEFYEAGLSNCEWCWNNFSTYPPVFGAEAEYLNYLFFTENIQNYDPRHDKTVIGGVESNVLLDWIKNRSATTKSGWLDVPSNRISADLFMDKVDNGRTRGLNQPPPIRADAHENLLSFSSANPGIWAKWSEYGLFSKINTEKDYIVKPIEEITEGMLSLADEDFSERYLIDLIDVPDFKDYCRAEYKKGGRVHVFRFAVTDYYRDEASIVKYGFANFDGWTRNKAYIAQQTCFFDFDVIDVEFFDGTVYTVIPVVHDPIDIVPRITPPFDGMEDNGGLEWWEILLIAVVVIIALILLLIFAPSVIVAVLKGAVKVVVFVVTLPFKVISKIFKRRKTHGKKLS